jgi:hypothetical protein
MAKATRWCSGVRCTRKNHSQRFNQGRGSPMPSNIGNSNLWEVEMMSPAVAPSSASPWRVHCCGGGRVELWPPWVLVIFMIAPSRACCWEAYSWTMASSTATRSYNGCKGYSLTSMALRRRRMTLNVASMVVVPPPPLDGL